MLMFFLIKSGPQNDIQRLDKLHERALKIIDNKQHPRATLENLRAIHRIPLLGCRQEEHNVLTDV